jgi:hypothetical protein
MSGDEVVFYFRCLGGSAGINSAEFYTCSLCGACIIEMRSGVSARGLHNAWHALQKDSHE